MTAELAILEEDLVKKLHLSPHFSLPQRIVTEKIAILGATGSGKTTTASVLVEELLKLGLPVDIIDPTDAWWGLRSSKDGKSPGYPVTVLGGDHGDMPLEETAGVLIADLIAEKAPPLVISLAHFSKSAMRRFMADFAERLYQKNRRAVHLVLDEADESAPQDPRKMKGGERLYGAIDQIVRRGRIRGLGVTMISQRSAEISKSILSQCSVLIAHRASHPTDLDPIFAWMKFNARDRLHEVEQTIAKLDNGEAWVMSPELLKVFARVQIRDRETFNSSATPEPGVHQVVPKQLAKVDLEALQERMRETVEKAKANDPAMLRRTLAERDRRIAELEAKPAPAAAVEIKEVPVLTDDQVTRLEATAEDLRFEVEQSLERIGKLAETARAVAKDVLDALDRARPIPGVKPPRAAPQRTARLDGGHLPPGLHLHATPRLTAGLKEAPRYTARPGLVERGGQGSDGVLPPAALRMLDAIARCHPNPVTRSQLATLSGYNPTGGGFRNTLSQIRTAGLIVEPGDRVALSPHAVELYAKRGGMPPPQTAEEVRAMWREKLPPAAWRMLEVVLARGEVTRADLAAEAGYELSGGGFRNTLSVLSSNGLILKDGQTILPQPTLALG